MSVEEMQVYCELTREQIEAALNFVKYVNEQRGRGGELDVSRLRRVIVLRDPQSRGRVAYRVELDQRTS